MLAPSDQPPEGSADSPARPVYARLLIGAALAACFWALSPRLPRDQTLVFELGQRAADIARLDVAWESAGGEHQGQLTLNFPSPTPGRVVRQFRMTDGEYAFRITAVHRNATPSRTELVRQVTLDGNNITLRLDELSP